MIAPRLLVLLVTGVRLFSQLSHAADFGAVKVAGVSLKGLNRNQATRRLKRELQPKLQTIIALAAGPRALKRKRGDVGAELDLGWMLARAERGDKFVPLKLRVDRARGINALRQLAPRFKITEKPARPIFLGQKVQIRPEQGGVQLNVGGSILRLQQAVEKNAANRRIPLMVHRSKPDLIGARLKGINAILATYTSKFNSHKVKRTGNVKLGVKAIDGTLLSPGETFSLNDVVGERTQARGYRTTIIFKNGYQAPGIGGGISQVTGTLFNAALLAGLPIVSYRTHSRPVSYLPIGRDATVAWGSFDMKFKNDLNAPIYISYKISSDHATARLYGPKTGKNVSLNVVSHYIGPREIKAKLYRTIRQNGKVVSEAKVGDSHYQWKVGEWED